MGVVQFLKREHARTVDLLGKLSETSAGAVKTRERLIEELRARLEFDARALQEHVVPALQRHDETAPLAKEANKVQKQLRSALSALDELPEDEREFARKLRELKREVQQYFREEEKSALAPLKRALSDEDEEELTRNLREAKREEPEEAEQGNEQVPGLAYARADIKELKERIGRMPNKTGQVSQAVLSAGRIYAETAQGMAGRMQALMRMPACAGRSLPQVEAVWAEWLRDAGSANVHFAQELLGCHDLQSVAQAQQRFIEESTRRLFDCNARMLEITQHMFAQALQPLEPALEGSAQEGRLTGSGAKP
jgi:hypothetical protein